MCVLVCYWSLENYCLMHQSVGYPNLQSSSLTTLLFLLISSRGRSGAQTQQVPTEDTPTIKSGKDSTLGCKSTVDNDVPNSWNLRYLYYLNGPLSVGRIRGLVRV